MNAIANEIIEDAERSLLEQALDGLDRTEFRAADEHLREADETILGATQAVNRATRLLQEARTAKELHASACARALAEGVEMPKYDGPDLADAQATLAAATDQLRAMQTARDQAVFRRSEARRKLRAEVERRLADAWCALAEQMIDIHQALDLIAERSVGEPYMPSWHRLCIPAPVGRVVTDDGLIVNGAVAARRREAVKSILADRASQLLSGR